MERGNRAIEEGAEQSIKSLGDWLQKVEAIGELKRITALVDTDLEMSTITYMNGKTLGGPTLLFENIKGHPGGRLLFNPIGSSLNRIALAIREEPGKSAIDLTKILSQKMKKRIPPHTIEAELAPVNENIDTGGKVDVTKFPAPKMWPLDGGKYIGTADAVITIDPANDRVNLGTFRQMIQGPSQVGFYASPGKDAVLDRELWWAQGKPAPVAAVYGLDPLLFLVASTSFPKNVSEYEFAGGINGAPIEVFRSDVTGLLLPANAELIIEGFSYPDKFASEGPFGEFTGYYGRPGGPTPYIEIKAIRYRRNPIVTSALMADGLSNESGFVWGMTRAAKVWNDLDVLGVPGVQGVWSPPEAAAGGMTVVSIEQRYAGHAAQVAALAAQCMGGAYFCKYVVVVDEDVDPTNLGEVIWAMVTRSRPAQSIDIMRETWSTYLDPSQNPPELRPWGSKCVINACKEYKYIKVFSSRNLLKREMYDQVCARWQELGFEGAPPNITTFETLPGKHGG
jgi:4-hydroxy-3-polyprenylbenzoate decarboxylase